MIDLILFTFSAATFGGGFYCGKTFGTVAAMFKAAGAKIAGWFGK